MPKTHRKTRTGCRQCRRRRVKCDEGKPSCANCNRNHLQCSLEFLTPINIHSGANIMHRQLRAPSKEFYSSTFGPTPELAPWSFDSKTHELLHHYTTVVAASLAGPREPSIWHTEMPHMALSHPFLLSGLLAVSALHLSTLYHNRKCELQNLAVAQEYAALPSYQKTLRNPNVETIHAIFAFAGYVVPYILASEGGSDRCRLPTKRDDHPHWFQAIRGLMVLLINNWPALSTGPFGALLYRDMGPHDPSDNPHDDQLAKLEEMFPVSSPLASPLSPPSSLFFSPPYAISCREGRKLDVCREALNELRRVSALPYSPSKTLCAKTIVYIWPGSISQEYIDLIYERDPRALIVLAYFCVLLKRNDYIWFLEGLGSGLLGNIWEALGEDWRPWIQWAMDQPCLARPEV